MADSLQVVKTPTLDILEVKGPALSATSDMPVVETKPDASNQGKPPEPEAPKEEVAEAAEGSSEPDKTEGESATPPAETAASDEPVKKPAKGVQKALDRLTKQREEAEARAKQAEENLARVLKSIEEGRIQAPVSDQPPQAEEDPAPAKPDKATFSDPDAWDAAVLQYAEDKAAWTARREVKAAREADLQRQQQQAQQDAAKATQEAFKARTEQAKAKYEDFDQYASTNEVQVTMAMAHAIVNHEQGPDIQYFLGKNPEEAKRISSLPVANQIMELGVIAAGLRTPAPQTKPKPVTAAPPPIKPVERAGETVTKDPSEMNMEEYAAYRKPQLQAEKRPGRR